MGCFSNLAVEDSPYDHDSSYTSAKMQLLWRLEALQDRLEELTFKRRMDRITLSEDNLRYVLPEHLVSVADVEAAIELAINDLKDRYAIRVREQAEQKAPVAGKITGVQISFLDILPAYSQHNAPCAV